MPQATTTVTPCAKSVEELRVVEISFYDHEVYAVGKLIASIRHDDDLTQPWLVLISNSHFEINRALTPILEFKI